jgi:hypothetical protein
MIKGKKVTEDVSLTPVRDEQKIVHQEFEQEHTQVEKTATEAVPESSAPQQALEVEALEGAVPELPRMVVGKTVFPRSSTRGEDVGIRSAGRAGLRRGKK